jgi:hypothetical protein
MPNEHLGREARASSALLCPPLARRLLRQTGGGPFGRSVALVARSESDRTDGAKTCFRNGAGTETYGR